MFKVMSFTGVRIKEIQKDLETFLNEGDQKEVISSTLTFNRAMSEYALLVIYK